jgi:hypothetical protein
MYARGDQPSAQQADRIDACGARREVTGGQRGQDDEDCDSADRRRIEWRDAEQERWRASALPRACQYFRSQGRPRSARRLRAGSGHAPARAARRARDGSPSRDDVAPRSRRSRRTVPSAPAQMRRSQKRRRSFPTTSGTSRPRANSKIPGPAGPDGRSRAWTQEERMQEMTRCLEYCKQSLPG